MDEYEMNKHDYQKKIQMLEKRIQNALNMAIHYGMIEGASCKQWVIDQMVRSLLSGDGYIGRKAEWRGEYGGKHAPCEWDEGTEP